MRFVKRVGLWHLFSLLSLVILISIWVRPQGLDFLARLGVEGSWLLAIGSLAALASLRSAPAPLQFLVFLLFALSSTAAIALWTPFIADEFPDYATGFAWTVGSAWTGAALYHVFAGRDHSFVGGFMLTMIFTAVSLIVFTIVTDIIFSQAFAIFVVVAAMVFYWFYDLAMVLRRRKQGEVPAAVMDLYRDALNFVGFPIRVMRMPKGLKRIRY
ncbi:MAG: Bax inhibitor-1 family protein [Fimbriimonadales bacterium]